jgi:bifunctional DNA-binding transcriptional regulator/antitoxin component of YhaV-PrlF toxin-antitoxin module
VFSYEINRLCKKSGQSGKEVLPVELRRTFDIAFKDPMEIYVDGEQIILTKYEPRACSVVMPGALKTTKGRTSAIIVWKN